MSYSRVVVTSEDDEEATGHDIRGDDILGTIGIDGCATIEKVRGDLMVVDDDHGLTGRIKVEKIAWLEEYKSGFAQLEGNHKCLTVFLCYLLESEPLLVSQLRYVS